MAISFTPWQWGVFGVVYVVAFILPAVWMFKKARRDEDESPFVWMMLVLVGSFMGIYEYYHHRGILKARARRAARRAEAEGAKLEDPSGSLDAGETDGGPGR